MRAFLIFIIVLFYYNSYSSNIDTIFLSFNFQKNLCKEPLNLKVLSKENKIIKELFKYENLKEIKIPIQKGNYNVLIESQCNLPLLLHNVYTNKHYFNIELFSDLLIKDTIEIEPKEYIFVSSGFEASSSIFKLSDKESLATFQAVKWQNPFQLNWDYFEQSELNVNEDCNSEICCDIFIEIKKSSIFSWNYIKSSFTLKRTNKENYLLNQKLFTVIAYINPYLSKVNKANMTYIELLYNRTIFNIYELYARKLRQYLTVNNCIEIYNFKNYFIVHAKDACNNYISYFKQDTRNGKDEDKVKQWYKYIYSELKTFNKYAYDSYKIYLNEPYEFTKK